MAELIFSTGNMQKLNKGKSICSQYGIDLVQEAREIDEIQSEDSDYVAPRKAEAAFTTIGKPVLISDDSWHILGLNGFPGTYAKSINHWLSGEDLVRLTKHLEDRRVVLRQTLVYQDNQMQKLFKYETTGILLKESKGSVGAPIQKVVSFADDGTTSISEALTGKEYIETGSTMVVWHEFCKWYKEHAL